MKNPFKRKAAKPAPPVPGKAEEETGYQGDEAELEAVIAAGQDEKDPRAALKTFYALRGARKAFDEGRAGNLQLIVSKYDPITGRVAGLQMHVVVAHAFIGLDAAQFNTVTEKFSGDARQKLLVVVLTETLPMGRPADNALCAKLAPLVDEKTCPAETLSLLLRLSCRGGIDEAVAAFHAKGADFGDTLFRARVTGHDDTLTYRALLRYQEKLTGKKGFEVPDPEVKKMVADLQQQVKDLTEKVEKLPTAPRNETPPTP